MRISHFRHIALRTPEVLRSAQFCQELHVETTINGAPFLRTRSQEHHQVELLDDEQPRIEHITFGVPDADAVEEAYSERAMEIETWQQRVWERRPDLMDLWGTSGRHWPEAREAMAGTPNPGLGAP